MKHVNGTPESPSKRTELDVPEELDDLILACLAKKPDDRPQDARELSERLAACHVETPWTPDRAEKWWQTHMPQAAAPLAEQTAKARRSS